MENQIKRAGMSASTKFQITHEIVVPGPDSRLTISVMLRGRNLWQRSEHQRNAPFPMWKLIDGRLYRHGAAAPAMVTIHKYP